MPLSSYRILSPVYISPLPSVRVQPKEIAPEEHKSMIQAVPNSFSSWPYNLSKPTSPTIIGDVPYMRSSSRLEAFSLDDFARYGLATSWEERGQLFQSWLDAGQRYGPKCFDYVRPTQKNFSSGAVESFGDSLAKFHNDDTPVRKHVHYFRVDEWPNNEVGKAVSRIENSRQSLMRYLITIDAQELSNYLKSLGYRAADIDNLGVGYLPEVAIYGVTRTESGRIRLSVAEDAYDKIVRDAKFLGVKPEDLLNSILAEELVHIWQRDFDKDGDPIKIEIAAKERVARHYERLAKGADGDPKKGELKRKYQKLAAVKKLDAETTPQRYSRKGSYKELYSRDRTSLELMLELDAMEEGYRGEKVREYVKRHLKDIGEEVEENGKPHSMSRLEKIADKESPEPKAEAAEAQAN